MAKVTLVSSDRQEFGADGAIWAALSPDLGLLLERDAATLRQRSMGALGLLIAWIRDQKPEAIPKSLSLNGLWRHVTELACLARFFHIIPLSALCMNRLAVWLTASTKSWTAHPPAVPLQPQSQQG